MALLPEFSLVPFPEQLGPYWYTSSAVEAMILKSLVLGMGTGNSMSTFVARTFVSAKQAFVSARRTLMTTNPQFGRGLAAVWPQVGRGLAAVWSEATTPLLPYPIKLQAAFEAAAGLVALLLNCLNLGQCEPVRGEDGI